MKSIIAEYARTKDEYRLLVAYYGIQWGLDPTQFSEHYFRDQCTQVLAEYRELPE